MYLALIHHIPRLVGFILLWDGAYKLVNPGQATMALESLEMPYGLAKTIVSSSIIVELYLGVLLSLRDRKSTRLNSSHGYISYAVFCLKKKKNTRYSTYMLHASHENTTSSDSTSPADSSHNLTYSQQLFHITNHETSRRTSH